MLDSTAASSSLSRTLEKVLLQSEQVPSTEAARCPAFVELPAANTQALAITLPLEIWHQLAVDLLYRKKGLKLLIQLIKRCKAPLRLYEDLPSLMREAGTLHQSWFGEDQTSISLLHHALLKGKPAALVQSIAKQYFLAGTLPEVIIQQHLSAALAAAASRDKSEVVTSILDCVEQYLPEPDMDFFMSPLHAALFYGFAGTFNAVFERVLPYVVTEGSLQDLLYWAAMAKNVSAVNRTIQEIETRGFVAIFRSEVLFPAEFPNKHPEVGKILLEKALAYGAELAE